MKKAVKMPRQKYVFFVVSNIVSPVNSLSRSGSSYNRRLTVALKENYGHCHTKCILRHVLLYRCTYTNAWHNIYTCTTPYEYICCANIYINAIAYVYVYIF